MVVLTDVADCVVELFDKLLLTTGLIEQSQIEGDEVSPVHFIESALVEMH